MLAMQKSTVASPVQDTPCLAAGLPACLRRSQAAGERAGHACSATHVVFAGRAFVREALSVDEESAADGLLRAGVTRRSVRQKGVLRQDERFVLAGFASGTAGRVASGSSYLHIGQGVETRQQRARRDVLPCRYSRQGVSPRKSQRRRSRQAAGVHFSKVEAAGATLGCPGRRQTDARHDRPSA